MDATTKIRLDAPGLDELASTAVVPAGAASAAARDNVVEALASYVEYAGFLPRWAALTLDELVLVPLFFVFEKLVALAPAASAPLSMLMLGLACGYEIYCTGRWGRTAGKWAVGLEVRMEDGGAPTWKAAWMRSAVTLVLYMMLAVLGASPTEPLLDQEDSRLLVPILLLVAWWLADVITFAASETSRSLHDRMAGTVVIRGD